jgi:hypothetical protein
MATEKKRGIGGRSAIDVEYIDLNYNSTNKYTIGIITKLNGDLVPFIIDFEDKEKVSKRNWHIVNGYIGSAFTTTEGKRKSLFMHNFIMNKLDFTGKGSKNSIDHINGIELDNRKYNLRETSQSMQNHNTSTRKRKADKFPEGFDASKIPTNIWYIPADKSHGDRFCVEIKGIPDVGDICKKTSSSKSISIDKKLEEAIKIKNEIYESYPILKSFVRTSETAIKNKLEFEEIISIIEKMISKKFIFPTKSLTGSSDSDNVISHISSE